MMMQTATTTTSDADADDTARDSNIRLYLQEVTKDGSLCKVYMYTGKKSSIRMACKALNHRFGSCDLLMMEHPAAICARPHDLVKLNHERKEEGVKTVSRPVIQ